MGVNDKVCSDLDLSVYRMSNLGMGVYAIERSYPKAGVGQICKQYLNKLKTFAYLLKFKHCAKVDADTDSDRRQC